jgi:spore photoproduct lyase
MISYKTLKSKTIRYSGRSSDYIFPTLVQGCLGGCKYCYGARHSDKFQGNLLISENVDEIINTVKKFNPTIEKPNQTHSKYTTWDIGCNSDISVDINYTDWIKVFDYFKNSERDFATFATKFTNPKLLTYNAEKKIRIRMSLMPDIISKIFEPNTSSIKNRIEYINKAYNAGYEVHLNFSPVIYFKGWKKAYIELFNQIDSSSSKEVKDDLACEVIFLTHNEKLHYRNLDNNFKYEDILWYPALQEAKTSGFGGKNVRYEYKLKKHLVNEFKELINNHIPYCNVRYIF